MTGRPLRIVHPHTSNGVYLDKTFGRRRRLRGLRARLSDWVVAVTIVLGSLIAILGVVALLVLVIVVPIWLLLALGRALGAVAPW